MRQTFFHELEELEKQEEEEKKEQKELYLRNRACFLRDSLPFLSLILIVIFGLLIAVYALYLFIDVSRISDIADVHISNSLNLAKRTVQGNVYNNPEFGIKNWMTFRDEENGFEVRYPESWKFYENKNHLFEIRKYNDRSSVSESLSAAAFIDKWKNENSLSLEDFVSENMQIEKDFLAKKSLNGIELAVINGQKDETGFSYSMIFWEKNKEVYSFKAIYYNQKNQDEEREFNEIINVMDIR